MRGFQRKTYEFIWQNIGQSHALAIGYIVDIVFPIFDLDSSCPQPNLLSESSYKCPTSIPYTLLQKLVHIMTNSYHESGKRNFFDWIISATIHLGNPANKGNNIRHSQLIHLPNMSILTMLETYSNNLHELSTVYWGQKKNQIQIWQIYPFMILPGAFS